MDKKRIFLKPIFTEYDEVCVVERVTPEMEKGLFAGDKIIYIDDENIYFRQPSNLGWLWIPHSKSNGWTYVIRNGKITISPSIKTDGGYYMEHYFIRENKVVWLPDSTIEEGKINQ